MFDRCDEKEKNRVRLTPRNHLSEFLLAYFFPLWLQFFFINIIDSRHEINFTKIYTIFYESAQEM